MVRAEIDTLREDAVKLRTEVERLRVDTKAEIARLEARMDGGFNAVRSDLKRVALAVGAGGSAAEG